MTAWVCTLRPGILYQACLRISDYHVSREIFGSLIYCYGHNCLIPTEMGIRYRHTFHDFAMLYGRMLVENKPSLTR